MSHFRIQTRRQGRHCSEGPRPRRLTKTLQPSSQCPMEPYQSHRVPDSPQTKGWCVCTRDTRQGPDRSCFSTRPGQTRVSRRLIFSTCSAYGLHFCTCFEVSVSPRFVKTVHVDGITTLSTLQTFLGFLFEKCVPLLHLLHDVWRVINVPWIRFELLHLFRSLRKSQVFPSVDGSPTVSKSSKWASFCVTLLCATFVREGTSQEIIGLQFSYWCMVLLWPGRHKSGDLHRGWWRHFSCFHLLFGWPWIILYRKKNSCVLGGGVSRTGVKEGRKGTKKKFNFLDRTWGMCGELTSQPHVWSAQSSMWSMCGPVWHHWSLGVPVPHVTQCIDE